jgi:molybdate transport system substrate-binding protein
VRRAPAVIVAAAVLAAVTSGSLSGTADQARGERAPNVAAAANLNFALTEISKRFTQETGRRVELVFGASGALVRQIRDGAPFEMFLAADEDFPNLLSREGLARDAGVVYAVGRLALFAPTASPLVVDGKLLGLANLLKSGGVTRFAIANPEVAPYGRAAEAVLRKHGLWDGIRSRLVLGDSISQAAQFATTGNAVGGLLAYSLAIAPEFAGRGTHALIPEGDHPPLRQRMVLLRNAGPVASDFFAFVQSESARAIFRKHGYDIPR